MERSRRSRLNVSSEILFDEAMIPTVSQKKYLSNDKNKNRLDCIIKEKNLKLLMMVKQATEHADRLIINTAISMSYLIM